MATHLRIAALIALFLNAGCAERNAVAPKPPAQGLAVTAMVNTPGWATDIWVSGSTAYIADDQQGVGIWDVSDLSNPALVGTIATNGNAQMVMHAPLCSLLFTMETTLAGGVAIYDMRSMTYLKSLWDSGIVGISSLELASDTIIVGDADNPEGFKFSKLYFDADEREWIDERRGSYNQALGILRNSLLSDGGRYAYLAYDQVGIIILDIDYSTETNFPVTVLGGSDTPGAARDLALNGAGTHLLVADFQSGLQVIDIQDKSAPQIVGSYLPSGVDQAINVVAKGDTAYFIDRYNGIFAIDVSSPQWPTLVGRFDSPDPSGLFVRDDGVVFLTDLDWGLIVLEWK